MPFFKCVWFFEGVQANLAGSSSSSMVGWTETWYREFTGGIEEAIVTMRDNAQGTWLQRRLACMASLYQCRWVRASAVDTPRLTKTASVPVGMVGEGDSGGHGIPVQAGGQSTAAQINCAVLVDFVAGPLNVEGNHHRRALIRGLPRAMINGNIIKEDSLSFEALKRFCDLVGRGEAPVVGNQRPLPSWLIRIKNPATSPVPITGLVINPGNPRQIQLTAALGAVAQNARVSIRGVEGINGVDRIWTNTAASGGPPYTLAKSRKNLAGAWVANTGTAIVNSYLYRPVGQYVVIGLRNKSIGRPFRLTRGRRRVL